MSGAESAFLLDRGGALVAASTDRAALLKTANWFVTLDAYDAAITGRLGRSFGLSPPDNDRRYFYVRRVSDAHRALGVLVVAIAIDELELLWRLAKRQVLVVDSAGLVVLAAQPAWQFLGTGANSGAAPGGYRPLPFDLPPIDGCGAVFEIDGAGQLCQARRIHHLEWDVYLLSPTGPLVRQAWFVTFAVALGLLSAGLIGGFAWQRLTEKDRTNRALQSRVTARTAELQAANTHLREEVQSRIAKEKELHQTQDELVQAGKMAALGQMAAGLVHELNQPLAAMRTYNDNTAAFLRRDMAQAAGQNIGLMQELIERMASITAQLKNFVRRTPLRLEPVDLGPAIASAIKLIEDTTPESQTRIIVADLPGHAIARAEPVRLQQVLVNLIRNGIDAIGDRPGQVTIAVQEDQDRLAVTVADDGPGIPP
ncbi:MAG: sensor histidine kinase, partial [Alphaproteobacteria bacterium]